MNMTTMRSRVRQDNVRITSKMTEKPGWADFGEYWYKVTLRRKGRQLTIPFGMGAALTHEPTAEEVLESLASDASSADQSFEDWASDYGHDTDSRTAEFTFRQVQAQTAKLKRFLGADFEAYVFNTDG
jgi:hypothetical protein